MLGELKDQRRAEFLALLSRERKQCDAPRPLRAMAEAFALRALTLLFPQFARPALSELDRVTTADRLADITREAWQLETLLHSAIGPLVADAPAVAHAFFDTLPRVHASLHEDANAILAGDPAARTLEEVIVAYPGFLATAVHRLSHELYLLEVPLFPRLLSEWSHRETGIDIHPGAVIGRAFAIDHGTGVVIGETSAIGDRVRIYQGVTLGALAVNKRMAHRKRHPTIGNDVVVYANATILGGNTVVGDGSIIGGNVWLTSSVAPRSVVQFTSKVEPRLTAEDDGLEFHI